MSQIFKNSYQSTPNVLWWTPSLTSSAVGKSISNCRMTGNSWRNHVYHYSTLQCTKN